ncbi:tetratricopeptide repeat protein [Lignipirellula cremea]|uniref:Lipoprotein NlpI n=1 Tax=Lignipirellula cremea TaxID=2528010 RepID=A0A518DNW1_9BACT|nr:tetratricopeptide repeat protein [Lignipirellula cremea]QDU93525.1 lipoprotein NlpI [Lignipirellula cremea]
MIRSASLSFAFLLASLVSWNAWGQSFQDGVVAKADLKIMGKVFAHRGDVLTLESETGGSIVVRTLNKQRAQVRRDFVIPLAESAPLYTDMIREASEDSGLFVARASAFSAAGQVDNAIADCTKALDLEKGQSAPTLMARGVYYASINKFDEAIADFRAAIKLKSDFELARVNLANALMGKKDYDGAIDIYDQLIETRAKNARYYVERGVAFRHKEDWDSAIDDFTRALEIEPGHQAALSSRGFVCFLKGDHEAAVKDFTQMIKLNPQDSLSYNNRGYNHFLMRQYKEALADYEAAIKIEPKYAMALQNKAWLLSTCADDDIRDGKEAFAAAAAACQLRQYKVASDIKALAASYAELNDFKHAVEFQQRVIDMTTGDDRTTEEEIMKLYRASQPFRSSVQPVE